MPLMTDGMMMNTLEAGVTADSVMRTFSRNVSERERSWAYLTASPSTGRDLAPATCAAAPRSAANSSLIPCLLLRRDGLVDEPNRFDW